jgi:hypothetical protein
MKDLSKTPTIFLKSKPFSTKYLCFKNESEGLDSITNLVLPLNNTETQFVVAKSKYQNFFSKVNASNRYISNNSSGYIYEDVTYDKSITNKLSNKLNGSCDVKYDKCIVHFTSRNYFGSYDSLIFQAYVYTNNKSKLYLASFQFKKTHNLELKAEHMLYNEKLYTTQIEFDIPSVYSIFKGENIDFNKALSKALEYKDMDADSDSDVDYRDVGLLENTPIGINLYGVSGSAIGTDNYVRLKTLKIKSISIPYVYNRLDEISVDIYEAEDEGDFYYIDPKVSGYSSFVDYIESMGEDIRAYMIMHELRLVEVPINNDGIQIGDRVVTHKEYHIIDINEDDEDEEISKRFDAKIKYRPICMYADENIKAYIEDTIKIINTVDNTSYEVVGSIDIKKPKKYGKRLKRLAINNESRPIVNVYNKKVSDENGTGSKGVNTVLGMNRSGGFVVENMTQNITSFIECTNIGVSVVELSPDDIN